jgi:signal transduction histidine kinase
LQQLLPEPEHTDHPASDASTQPSLKVLLARAEVYLAEVASERTVLNTSTKVLAYQKFNAESILRSIPDAVLVLDESGQVTFANQQFLRWYQLQDESIVGTMPTQWCSDPHMLGFLQRYEGQPARRAEVGNPQSDPAGKPGATLSMSAFPMFSSRDEKHISSTLIVFSDITTQVMAQKARDEFAAALAHELKTPLHSIGMHAELLLGEDGDDHGLRIESANYINTEVEHISELVRNMLNITRIETGSLSINRKLTKLGDLLNNAMDNLETTAREQGVTIRRQLPDTVEPSYLDKDLLRVAVNNLLSNAIKYNRQGGEVVVSLSENDSNLVLTVADTGIGISEDDKQHVFDKFFRSEDEQVRHRSGHGLGLSLVREIVELHNGTISVESAIGEGSEFTLRIKRISVPLQEAA